MPLTPDEERKLLDKFLKRVKNREAYAKHAQEHRVGGFDSLNIGGETFPPGGGSAGKWPVMTTASSLAIVSGAITISNTNEHYRLTGEGGLADNLDMINGFTNNKFLVLRKEAGGVITIRSGQGNIYVLRYSGDGLYNLTDSNDVIVLDSSAAFALLWYNPDLASYEAIGFTAAGGVGGWVNSYLNAPSYTYPALTPTGHVRFNDSLAYGSGASSNATIASDKIADSNANVIAVAPETGTTDNLVSLVMTQSNKRGDWFVMGSSSSSNTITVKHNSGSATVGGKFILQGAADIALNLATDKLIGWYDQTADSGNGAWICFPFGTAGTGGGGPFLRQDGTSPLTGKWDQSGAFDIVQRGGNLLVANSKALKLYSDNSATPSTLTASIDATRGDILAAGHASIGKSPVYDPQSILTFNESRTSAQWATLVGGTPTTIEGIVGTISVAQSASINYPITALVGTVGFNGNFTAGAATLLTGAFLDATIGAGADAPAIIGAIANAHVPSGASQIDDRYGFWAEDTVGSGVILRQYGFYVPAFTKGSTNWAFYSVSANSAFGGSAIIGGTTTPATTLDVRGAVTLDGVSAPSTPASDDIVVYNETGTDLLKAKDDNGFAYALTHKHFEPAVMDVTVASTTVPYHVLGPMPHAGVITDVRGRLGENKTNGATSSIFDVHLIAAANQNTDGQGTTIFTTQANRPTITNGNMLSTTTAPDVTTFAAGDYLVYYTDQSGTTATSATVTTTFRYT